MVQDELEALVESIQMHGLRDAIVLFDGQVLDGWHRYQACLAAGMPPSFIEFEGDDPVDFITDKHTRRSLTLTQRMVAIALMNRWAPSGGAGKQSRVAVTSTLTLDALAKQAGGSKKTAQQVKAAITTGRPEVVKAMQAGELSAERAAAIAKLPAKEQVNAITAPKITVPVPEDDGPDAAELAANAAAATAAAQADAAMVQKLLESDAPLAEALAENKRLNAEVAALRQRLNGLMSEKNEAIALVKSRDRTIAKLEKLATA